MGISYIKLVGVSHQEAHLLKLVLLEGQDEHSKLVVVDVTQNVEYGVNLVEGDVPDHSNVVENVKINFHLLLVVLQVDIDRVLESRHNKNVLIEVALEVSGLPFQRLLEF